MADDARSDESEHPVEGAGADPRRGPDQKPDRVGSRPAEPGRTGRRESDEGAAPPVEVGGYDGPDPTRYGDWEHRGRCTDF